MIVLARIAAALVLGQTAAPAQLPPPSEKAAPGNAQPALPVLTLEEALREAQTKNLDVKQSFARLDQANQASSKAWSFYLPQLAGNVTYTRNEDQSSLQIPSGYVIRDFGTPQIPPAGSHPVTDAGTPTNLGLVPYDVDEMVLQKQDQLTASLRVTQALIAPALWPAIQNAYRYERLAVTNVEGARRDILFGVAQLYYGAAGLKQAVTVQTRQLVIASNHERDARVRYQAGTTPKVALLRAEIDRAKAEQDLKRAQNAYLSAKVQLATLLDRQGADFEVEVPVTQQSPSVTANLEETALRDRSDVQAAQQSLELAEGLRTQNWSQYFPSLGAFGQLNWANLKSPGEKRTSWALGLSLNWNIFDGGLREANIRESQARVAEAQFAQESTQLKAREDVRKSLLDLDSALANKATSKEQVDLARENEKLIEVNYRAGAATYIEVADAQAALLSAELNYVAESLNADLATVRLQKAIGAFRGPQQ